MPPGGQVRSIGDEQPDRPALLPPGVHTAGPGVHTAGPGAAKAIDEATGKVLELKQLNDDMQKQFAVGSPSWHQCESIDDVLHDILALLGA